MRHAYLIIAHNEPQVLATLLRTIDDARNDIYLHVDAKTDARQFNLSVIKKSKLIQLPRMSVNWGGVSQPMVEYRLFATALGNGPYAYYHLLSGTDLPLRGQDEVHAFFDGEGAGREYVEFNYGESFARRVRHDAEMIHLFGEQRQRCDWIGHLLRWIRTKALGFQRRLDFRRELPFEIRYGSNWVSITQAFCEYLVENSERFLRAAKWMSCSDEFYVQTVLWNSPFRERAFDLDGRGGDTGHGAMREIDWRRGNGTNPYCWQMSDFEYLKQGKMMFARKFTSKNMEVVHAMEVLILG